MKFLATLALFGLTFAIKADEEVVAHANCTAQAIQQHLTDLGNCPARERSKSIYSFNQKDNTSRQECLAKAEEVYNASIAKC